MNKVVWIFFLTLHIFRVSIAMELIEEKKENQLSFTTLPMEIQKVILDYTDMKSPLIDEESYRTLYECRNSINLMAFSPNGQWVASALDHGSIGIWQIATGALVKTLNNVGAPFSIAFSPDSSCLALGLNGTVGIWQIATNDLAIHELGNSGLVLSVVFSPDGKWLGLGTNDNALRLWKIATNRFISQCSLKNAKFLKKHEAWVKSLAFSCNVTLLASGSEDGIIKIWNIGTDTLARKIKAHSSSIISLAFSPDVTLLASASYDGVIGIWHVKTGYLKERLHEHEHSTVVSSIAFSPDSDWLAFAPRDTTIGLWHVKTGMLKKQLTKHDCAVRSLAFSSDGRWLISGSQDKTVNRWSFERFEEPKRYEINNERIDLLRYYLNYRDVVHKLARNKKVRFTQEGAEYRKLLPQDIQQRCDEQSDFVVAPYKKNKWNLLSCIPYLSKVKDTSI